MDASLSHGGSLQEVIDHLRSLSDELPEAVAGLREDTLTPPALASDLDELERWLDVQAIAADGMDRRTQAAYMIGGLAWSVAIWMAAFELTGHKPIRRVGLRQERYWYRYDDGTSHEYVRYPIAIEVGDGPANHRETLEEMFAPLIAATMVTSGLSPGAQWRLVADNVANAFLWAGKGVGVKERGMELGATLVAEGRLYNGKTGYLEVTAGERSDHFLTRGGCCRYYLTKEGEGEYCTSCVLRKREDQIARYTDYLASLQTLE
jgi:hypothetical protein